MRIEDKDFVKKKQKSKNARYTRRRRTYSLSQEQLIAVDRVAEDLVNSLYLLVDDRIEENRVLRILFESGDKMLQEEAREAILVKIRVLFAETRSL